MSPIRDIAAGAVYVRRRPQVAPRASVVADRKEAVKHARDSSRSADTARLAPSPAPARSRRARRRKGRHFAEEPRRWPQLAVGVVVLATAATGSVTMVASGDDGLPLGWSGATGEPAPQPGPAVPVDEPGATATAAPVERVLAASRSGERAAPAAAATPSAAASPPASPAPSPTPTEAPPPPAPILEDCDGEVTEPGTNGYVPHHELCGLRQGGIPLRADAAVAFEQLNEAYRARFGEALCITGGYRSYAAQVRLRSEKPSLAARPGTSNHGWGLAVDLCDVAYAGNERWAWLLENGPRFGWDNPEWARRGGSGPYEPWHWEYTDAVHAMLHG
jgi:hypothetical protein